VIVDSGSTDETLTIAGRFPNVRTVHRPFDTYAQQWRGRGRRRPLHRVSKATTAMAETTDDKDLLGLFVGQGLAMEFVILYEKGANPRVGAPCREPGLIVLPKPRTPMVRVLEVGSGEISDLRPVPKQSRPIPSRLSRFPYDCERDTRPYEEDG
jgi:hypothetical protein